MTASPFTFNAPGRIIYGWGSLSQLPAETAQRGSLPLIVSGRSARSSGTLARIEAALSAAGLQPQVHEGVPPEPDLAALQACVDAAAGCDSVIAVGGGSVLDVAKGAAALTGDPGVTAADYFSGKPVPERGLPLIAVPTTSGTGSEVTWVCVLVDHDTRRKASIRGGGMMPAVALVDPELTVSCPPKVTAQSGMDAFVQAVESFTSKGANPMTDALSLEGARLTGQWVETAYREPSNREAREAMALGSMMAGLALNTSRLGLVHGLAHPLGAVTGAAHGLLCGLLMPPVMRFNRDVSMERYGTLAVALGLVSPEATASAGADALLAFTEGLLQRLAIPPRLREIGFSEADLDWVAAETMPSGSTKANPRPVSQDDARRVAASCL